MRGLLRLVIAALCGALLTIAAQRLLRDLRSEDAVPPEQILAVVDERPITVADFVAEMERRGGEANFSAAEARRGLLDDMIRLEVLAANGRARGYLDDYGVRRDFDHILAGKYRAEEIDPELAALEVSDEEVAAFYEANRHRFVIPASAHAAVIYFGVGKLAPDAVRAATRERAAQVRAEAERQEGATHFGALAVSHSDDQATRYLGGDIGWVEAGQRDSRWHADVLAAIFALDQPAQLAPLVETADGIYLIRLLEKKAESLRPLDEVAPDIKQHLLAEKRHRRSEELDAAAASRVQVEVYEDRLPTSQAPERPGEGRQGPPPVPRL